MGLLSKIFILIIIAFAAYWAYDNIHITTMNICVSPEKDQTSVTCVTSRDCANFMTSVYGEYPETTMYKHLLTQTTTCNLGTCEINHFEKKDKCSPGEKLIRFKATTKDLLTQT